MTLIRENSAGYMTNWAARLFYRELERQLAPLGINPAYMPILFALSDGSSLTQKELADRAAVEQPTMTATLSRMERDGFITRRPNPEDGRSVIVSLSSQGSERVPQVQNVVETINGLALKTLSEDERRSFFILMGKIIATLQNPSSA